MEIYECIFSLITGIGVFILAMKIMSDSLKELAGDKMKTLLEKLTSNRISGVLIGALATAIIQSSSATTVMVIGFVNADVMALNQAAAIIIGSNIGTTATGLLASLESLNISLYISMLVFVGAMLSFVKKLKKVSNLLTGLGMIFVGLKLMSSACNDDSIRDKFMTVLERIKFPLLLELLGVIFTAIIQSSSAMTGIVIVLVGNGAMSLENGLFITLGSNVGTCITALLGIIGGNINAKRTAVIHLIFNVFGVVLFTPILWIFEEPILSLLNSIVYNQAMQIAYFHLCFNIVTACITTPLISFLVKIAKKVVSDKPDKAIIEAFEEEKEKFAIRSAGSSFSNIDESTASRNELDSSRYDPPVIIDNYIKNKDDNEHDIYIDMNEDEEKKDKEEKDRLELIDVKKDDNKFEIKEDEDVDEIININKIKGGKEDKKKKNKNKKDNNILIYEEKNEEKVKEFKVDINYIEKKNNQYKIDSNYIGTKEEEKEKEIIEEKIDEKIIDNNNKDEKKDNDQIKEDMEDQKPHNL